MLKIIKLQQSKIDQIVDPDSSEGEMPRKLTTQAQFINYIFEMVYPDIWDQIDRIRGYPICNTETWTYLCDTARKFDKEHVDPHILMGGAWMNYGFSTTGSQGLAFMEVKQAPYEIGGQLIKDEEAA